MSNIIIEEYEDGILETTYIVKDVILNTMDEISVPVTYENGGNPIHQNIKTEGVEFVSMYITLEGVVEHLKIKNKIHIIDLSPEDRAFFEDPNLKLPNCIEFKSNIPLNTHLLESHTPSQPITYILHGLNGPNKCDNITMDELNISTLQQHIAKCLNRADDWRRIHIVRIKTSGTEANVYYVMKISLQDTMPSTYYKGGLKRTHKGKKSKKKMCKRKKNKHTRKV